MISTIKTIIFSFFSQVVADTCLHTTLMQSLYLHLCHLSIFATLKVFRGFLPIVFSSCTIQSISAILILLFIKKRGRLLQWLVNRLFKKMTRSGRTCYPVFPGVSSRTASSIVNSLMTALRLCS